MLKACQNVIMKVGKVSQSCPTLSKHCFGFIQTGQRETLFWTLFVTWSVCSTDASAMRYLFYSRAVSEHPLIYFKSFLCFVMTVSRYHFLRHLLGLKIKLFWLICTSCPIFKRCHQMPFWEFCNILSLLWDLRRNLEQGLHQIQQLYMHLWLCLDFDMVEDSLWIQGVTTSWLSFTGIEGVY